MFPFSSLPANLAAFCDRLRREHGFRIGPAELADAARALAIVPLGDVDRVRDALRLVLSSRVEDARVFDRAFAAFFLPGPEGVPQPGLPPAVVLQPEPDIHAHETRDARSSRPHETAGDVGDESDDSGAAPADDVEGGTEDAAARTAASWSTTVGAGDAPDVTRPPDAWRDAARALVRRVRLGRSRRQRPAHHGARFDLRRTLRVSLHTGGEALSPRWLARPRRYARFVLLLDGSRSMSAYSATMLRVALALSAATPRVEVFTFSTAIRRVTTDVRAALAVVDDRRRGLFALDAWRDAWGGGTMIGACLWELVRTKGNRLLGRDTCVIVASDGLDAGDPAALGDAMREIDRRSAGIVWLNPLLTSPGYQPIAEGMRVARPFVAAFAAVHEPADLLRLAATLRLR